MKSKNYDIIRGTKHEWSGGASTPRTVAHEHWRFTMQDNHIPNSTTESIPYGYCHCGCGEKTNSARRTDKRHGTVKGEPTRYLAGHGQRKRRESGYDPIWNNRDKCFDIPLPGGRFAKVDPEDIRIVCDLIWSNSHGYACSKIGGKRIHLHRLIMGTLDSHRSIQVDHINGDRLDNRRQNLRIATPQQNRLNVKAVRASSGYIGVHWSRKMKKWQVIPKVDGKSIWLGVFTCPIEAAIVRDIAVLELHGEFAVLNFPELRQVFGAHQAALAKGIAESELVL